MYAETIDTGPSIAYLRQYGPLEVLELDDAAGNGSVVHHVSGYSECVDALCVRLVTDNTAVDRFPVVEFFAGEPVPFARVVAPFDIGASHTADFTFSVGTFPGTSGAGSAFVAPLPEFLLPPGFTVAVSVIGGVAGDALTRGRLTRRQFQLIDLESHPGVRL